MDKALVFDAKDSRFESCQGQVFVAYPTCTHRGCVVVPPWAILPNTEV